MSVFTRSPQSTVLTDERGYKVDTTNPLPVDPAESGAANFTASQVSVTSSATQLLAANATRRSALITNADATTTAYVGKAAVTSSTGHPLLPGASISIPYVGAIYAITASATINVGASEVYD